AVVVLPVHSNVKKTYNADAVKAFRETINKVVKKHKAAFIDLLDFKLSDKLLQDNAHLKIEGKAAVTALLGEQLYFKNIISPMEICSAGKDFFDSVSKYFSPERNARHFWHDTKPLTHHIFCKMVCEDFNRLSVTLSRETCLDLTAHVFSELTYSYLGKLSRMLPKDDYNAVAARVFEISAEKIRRKDKIKVGFVLYDSSTWCGNDLYNFFARDERFEPTVFLSMRTDGYEKNKVIQKEFLRQTEQFKSAGLNVVAVDENSTILEQDLIFYLIPYDQRLQQAFKLLNINAKTLTAFIPYSIEVGKRYDATFTSIVRVAWKQFFPSQLTLEMYNRKSPAGTPQRVYSGYPKLDVFFKHDSDFHFDWKMTRPDAKKIIWAPHHSVNGWSIGTATFQWNHQFMYEFAKAHPEISWIVKPHSNLPVNALRAKVFPTIAAYEEYFQKWDALPNAKVVTGAYYQEIFATSDGIIHDCGSFTTEYQYLNKPMIYLVHDMQIFNELGSTILEASYTVDGRDLEGIAAMIQRVIIDEDDYKAVERREVFDKYLNYP
ncbi:MAG: CDP-glycerol glycerophosphotransferase family protein, partial [Selenomonadaceae bacterium]|nr:CDP-glycerol glycerophosphotransferase family protein [Selenomonadaceae bacterium]